MEISTKSIVFFLLLFLCNATIKGCIPSIEEHENSTVQLPFDLQPKFYSASEKDNSNKNSVVSYYSSHFWLRGGGMDYYGAEATPDVYNFNLQPGQESAASIWIIDRPSLSGIVAGWHVSPGLYNDSHTHFYTGWTSGPHNKGCTNMICPGFQKTSSSITPRMIIDKVSRIHGQKWYMRLRVMKEKSSGDWHIYLYRNNVHQELVGYFPKYLVPGLIDKQVEISFGGYVSHKKPQPSPPMGSGYVVASGNAASFNNLKLIDADGNDHLVNIDLPSYVDGKSCYNPSHIDPSAKFYYGGVGCFD